MDASVELHVPATRTFRTVAMPNLLFGYSIAMVKPFVEGTVKVFSNKLFIILCALKDNLKILPGAISIYKSSNEGKHGLMQSGGYLIFSIQNTPR